MLLPEIAVRMISITGAGASYTWRPWFLRDPAHSLYSCVGRPLFYTIATNPLDSCSAKHNWGWCQLCLAPLVSHESNEPVEFLQRQA